MGGIIGIDEVGRGCWAGPLVAAAVMLAEAVPPGLRDSKLLTRRQRSQLDSMIRLSGAAVGIGWVPAGYIDSYGLTAAVRLAMSRALSQLAVDCDTVVIDGAYNFLADDPRAQALVGADRSVPAVSAASIIAKVARDNYMIRQGRLHPAYAFERNVGYGTAVHTEALRERGPCILHRRSFAPVCKAMEIRKL